MENTVKRVHACSVVAYGFNFRSFVAIRADVSKTPTNSAKCLKVFLTGLFKQILKGSNDGV